MEEFRERAQRWQDTWNKARGSRARGSSGKGMKGETPYEKFKESGVMVSEHVCEYLVVILEEVFRKVGSMKERFVSGKYVFARYLSGSKKGHPSRWPLF